MLPEAKHVINEITVRKLTLSDELMSRKALIRWLALSLGLISERESRTLILPILEKSLELSEKNDKFTSKELIDAVKGMSPEYKEKAIRYHISQLKKKGILFELNREYYLGDPSKGKSPEERLRSFYIEEVKQVFESIEHVFKKLRLLS